MKRLIVDTYRFIYLVSRAKNFSVLMAIIYVTVLNMVVLSGLGVLMQGLMPTSFITTLCRFPYYFFTGAVMFVVAYRYKPSKKTIAKEAKTTNDYTFILVYSIAALLLFLYTQFGAKINFNERKKIGNAAFMTPARGAGMSRDRGAKQAHEYVVTGTYLRQAAFSH